MYCLSKRNQTNFGNAGAVEVIAKVAMLKAAKRTSGSGETLLLSELDTIDPGTESGEKKDEDQQIFSFNQTNYTNGEGEISTGKSRRTWEVSNRDGDENLRPGDSVFTGSPGTAKNTAARVVIDKVLLRFGLLSSRWI
mmetsp:Transcript_29210/g.44839  ORF Transcript_29210/g.44839 Transcript_29210/m.44839 type:complete len:138 (+) Transcript_29210:459-872(+)